MPRPTNPQTRDRARAMRKDMSFPERLLWSRLKARRLDGLKFRRQAPVGHFITDFLSDEHRLAIELDGVSHGGAAAYDARRSAYLNQEGYRVVRYNHDEVLEDLDAVLRDIARRCGRDVSEGEERQPPLWRPSLADDCPLRLGLRPRHLSRRERRRESMLAP